MNTRTTQLNSRAPHVATGKVVAINGDAQAKLLYAAFEHFNAEHFEGTLGAPLVLITQAASARTLADYVAREVHGLERRIRIAPHTFARGPLFACDALLHEMVHAWQVEISGDDEAGYRGHGPKFAARCNAIGAVLGLPEVGVRGRGGRPDCARWPMCVRPEGYYGEAFRPPTRRQKKGPEEAREGAGEKGVGADVVAGIVGALGRLDDAELAAVGGAVIGEVEKRVLAVIGDEVAHQLSGPVN